MVVLHDLLTNLRLLILQHHDVDSKDSEIQLKIQSQQEELPLRPSLYEQLSGPHTSFWQRCLDAVLVTIVSAVIARDIARHRPILSSVREDQLDARKGVLPLPVNASYFLTNSGTKANLERALENADKNKLR